VPITVSARMILVQRDCRLVLCLLLAPRLQDQTNEVPLQPDRGSARRPMCCPALLALRGIAHLTSRALDRLAFAQAQSEQHAGRA
jgi:hypothetical protein